jgi:carnosine synthase
MFKMAEVEEDVQLDVDGELRHADSLKKLRPKTRSKFEVEQMICAPGKLPKPLATAKREQIIRQLLPTVTHQMLAALQPDVVEAQGLEGQTLRRRLVHGATVVFFTAGYAGKRFVFERANALGIKSVVIEHPDSWARGLVEEGLIAKFIPVDMARSSDEIFEESLALIKNLGADGVTGEADAICTFVELSVPLTARLCEMLGLPGLSPAAVDAARDKHATRKALKDAGLPIPRNMIIRSEADLAAAAEHVGFPAVLKPISGAASLGVRKVEDRAALAGCYREVTAELRSLVVVSGALAQKDGSGGVDASEVIDMSVLLEQYLDGEEVDIDMVVSEGEWRYAAITDNGPTVEPYFNETWGVCPSLLSLDKQRELKELAVKCVKALGLHAGVFHVECKYTSTGPQLIEVNARMGGGPVHEINLRCWGVDLVEEAIFVAMGIPSRPLVSASPLQAIAYYVVPAQKSGTVAAFPPLDDLRGQDDVVWAKPMVKVGDKVVGPADGLPTWLVDLMVTKTTAKEAYDRVMDLEATKRVVIE